jgi:hypothetical protein
MPDTMMTQPMKEGFSARNKPVSTPGSTLFTARKLYEAPSTRASALAQATQKIPYGTAISVKMTVLPASIADTPML